uniref:Phytocyanin domain-containing protein n=1 Tax=Brassica oleracea var. oleracea TaxID=109376 RepID=A0A0D3AJM0_BRAOL
MGRRNLCALICVTLMMIVDVNADFGFDLTRHNILQVNKSSYEQCINIDFISNVTRGGRDRLLSPGMTLTVNVLPKPAPSTPTAIITPASTTTTLIPSNAFAAVTMAILTFAFKTSYFN